MKLLVSVRNAQEAQDAVAGGTNWLDLKEPSRGPLGPVSLTIAQAANKAVNGRCSISAALGELTTWSSANELLTIPEIEVVKLGLAECGPLADWQLHWRAAFEICSQQVKQLAAVVYADWQKAVAPRPEEVLACALRAGSKYLLIDTFEKRGLTSVEILGRDYAARLLQFARQGGMITVLAGSLREDDLSLVVDLPVDIVAIRGAVCQEARDSSLDPDKVRQFRRCMEMVNKSVKDLNSYLTTRH
jgi:uncharacterized protein (UPF0264 family)